MLHDVCMTTKTPRPTPTYDAVCAQLGFSLETVRAANPGPALRTDRQMTKRARHKLAQRQNAIMAAAVTA